VRVISNAHLQRAATIVRAKAAPTDQISVLKDKIWTERLRIDRVAGFRVSAPRIFNVAASIVLVAEDSAVIASAAEDLAVADLADLADLAAEGSGVDGDNYFLNLTWYFL
jgi:hypothetical protein